MPRISTIAIDLPITEPPPPHWSGYWVRRRLVEAYGVERRLHVPGARGPTANGNGWPEIRYEFSDVVGWADAQSERVLEAWENNRSTVWSAEIERMDEARAWLEILRPYPLERHCLALWATMLAYRWPLRSVLRQRKWSRTTFYRKAAHGSTIIARNLNLQGIIVS